MTNYLIKRRRCGVLFILLVTLAPVYVISIFDAIAGGALRIVFRIDGKWLPVEQGANDAYHLIVALLTAALLGWTWLAFSRALRGWHLKAAVAVPFIFLHEDTLFYVFLKLVSPLHDAFLGPGMGEDRIVFPEHMSTYIGWLARRLGCEVTIPRDLIFAINAVGVSVFVLLLLYECHLKTQKLEAKNREAL